jgi:hypothetical protein
MTRHEGKGAGAQWAGSSVPSASDGPSSRSPRPPARNTVRKLAFSRQRPAREVNQDDRVDTKRPSEPLKCARARSTSSSLDPANRPGGELGALRQLHLRQSDVAPKLPEAKSECLEIWELVVADRDPTFAAFSGTSCVVPRGWCG